MTNEPLLTTAEKIERQDKENTERIQKLMSGASGGLPVSFPPGSFEMAKIISYLEHVLITLDIHALEDAKLDYAQTVAKELDKVEEAARQAKITQGTGIIHANGQTPPLQ
jgi:hypothetical protein